MMNILGTLKNAVQTGINTLSGKVVRVLTDPKKSAFPLADRLLADAFQLGQLPSPTEKEEARSAFVAERLDVLPVPYSVDEAGNILAELHPLNEDADISSEPLLVFTPLVSERWNSLESLGKLELQYARGAGLADALGPAALLSLAEAHVQGRLSLTRTVYLFFSALHFDNPLSDVFRIFIPGSRYHPQAAIGVRGFMLGFLAPAAPGSYRVELIITEEEGEKKRDNAVVEALTATARHYQKTAVSFGDGLCLYIKRIEARSSFNRTPSEGALELEFESSGAELLETALENIKAVAETAVYPGVKTSFRILSSTPPGDSAVNRVLFDTLLELMKELKIKSREEAKPDPAAFFSALGVPAVSLGIASGREGLNRDTVEIASIEKGRQLLEKLVHRAGTGFRKAALSSVPGGAL